MNRQTTSPASDTQRNRLIAAIAAVLFHVLLLVVCLFTYLRYPPEEPEFTTTLPEEENEITFQDGVDFKVGGSYTIPEEIIKPEPEPELSQGSQTEAAPLPQPTPQEIEQKKRDEIARRVKFATNNAEENAGDGGNAETSTATNSDINTEVIGLDGFSGEGFPRPAGFSDIGTIAINVTLDSSGRVIATSHNETKSNGRINNNPRAVKECLKTASQSKFKPRRGTTTGATGLIFYHFRK